MLCVALAACSGDASDEGANSIAGTASREPTAASPLDLFFGDFVTPERRLELTNAALLSQAEAITTCMADDGFAFYREPAEIREASRFSSRGWTDVVAQSGYGAVASIEGMIDRREAGGVPSEEHQENAEGFAILSPEGQAEFSDAFGGCYDRAVEEFPEPQTASTVPEEIQTEIARILQDIEQSSRFDEIWTDWADCMRQAGYDFTARHDAVGALSAEGNELRLSVQRLDPEAQVPLELLSQLDALGNKESSIVDDDLRCSAEVDLDRRLSETQQALEQEAVEAHGDRWTLTLGSNS